ncbi:Lon protease 2 [Fundidesulfovibrio magnetotacticus]|uniref:endopeptidase La n=1 Tax=Fundidesulfovibrio magnetotacticus TaxID=2730080 RepID=A0A6V8LPW5_9BACT|nr:S16 family serine protease [Fundidesulfovibrio magnetotacticus]GFK94592.1 Lon protease 2 [Fundidesulfovibrio magnetotacticus]
MIFFQKRQEGRAPEAPTTDLDQLAARADAAPLPPHAREAALRELARLRKTDPSVAEYSVGMGYLDFLLGLPWSAATQDRLDLKAASRILDARHHGLGQVKERVLEHLASRVLRQATEFHILVVDDEDIARANLEHVLKKEGYRVRGAANGLEALEEVRRWEFDLIVTDLKMEKMDGMQLLAEARRLSPSTQVMMVTGFATVDTAVQAMRQGAVYYLAKPVNLDELRSTVAGLAREKTRPAVFRSPVLCFAGPPGTGKTSVGQAIAEALGRKFHRMSLAGLRDEAELRGHRRTYVGALPGRVLQSVNRLGVRNPVFMLDELDKIGKDFRGDPAAVFLEMLDPEQNTQFVDNYLEASFDLSQTLFIATVNDVEELSGPLLDRLEVVPFQGYTTGEKVRIALGHLAPRQLRENGLTHPYPEFTPGAVAAVVEGYTREAGVRNLDRELGRACRKLALLRLEGGAGAGALTVDEAMVPALLGPARHVREAAGGAPRVGVATGLVYAGHGGEIIFVEAIRMKGTGEITLTGSLGEVLRESARTALSLVRSRAGELGIDPAAFLEEDLHVHIPAGSVPKEGSSAGLTLALALASLYTGRPLRRDVAMTGEITLSGDVLPVGGIREKLLAAARAGAARVILPEGNRPHVAALAGDETTGVEVAFVKTVQEALGLAGA